MAQFVLWFSRKEGRKKVEEEGKELERAAGGRAGAEAARLILFFPLLTLPTQVLLACLLCFALLACIHY